MKTSNLVSRIALSMALAVGIAGAGTIVAPAAIAGEAKKPTVSPAVGKPLQEAQTLLNGGKAKEAAAKAAEAVSASKTPYEVLVSNQIMAGAALKAGDTAGAAKALEGMLASGQVPDPNPIRKTLIQIHYQAKNFPKTIEAANAYLKDNPNDTEIPILVAQSYYLQNDFKRSADYLKSYVKSANSAGRAVKEDTLTLLMSAEYKIENDAGVASALEMLITRYPKPQYMKDFIAINEKALRGGSTKTQLDVLTVKYNAGLFDGANDYTGMTELALQDGLPGLAKQVMDKGMAAGVLGTGAQKDRETRMLTMATTQAAADQKGLAAGESEAAKAKTGEALIKYGEAYSTYGMHDKAIAAIESGIAKGVADKDDAQLRLGIAYMQAGQRDKALAAFKAITPGSVSAQVAALWRVQKPGA